MSPMPSGPWVNLSMDFYSLSTGEEVFVVIDDYSRFPEVHHVNSTSTRSTITCLERIFAQHGIPAVIRADNGPPFNGSESS
jgi:transposase InsO family protein